MIGKIKAERWFVLGLGLTTELASLVLAQFKENLGRLTCKYKNKTFLPKTSATRPNRIRLNLPVLLKSDNLVKPAITAVFFTNNLIYHI